MTSQSKTVERLLKRRESIDNEIARLEARPTEPISDEAVIWIRGSWNDADFYTYILFKTKRGWYWSGNSNAGRFGPYEWDDMLNKIEGNGFRVSEAWRAIEWEAFDL